jgi:predicted transcriptional regulator
MEITEVVLKTLNESEKPMKAGEIAEKSGLEKADVDKAIKKLKKEEVIWSPKVCFYEVKK